MLLYTPLGLYAFTEVQSICWPSISPEPDIDIPIVWSAPGPLSIRLMKSVIESFNMVSVKHALLFVALTS